MTSEIQDILRNDSHRLVAALKLDIVTARIEAQCLLQSALQVKRAYLLTYPEQLLTAEQQTRYTVLFERRLAGEPLAYILGEREFYGLNFKVTPDTLIPRADTELLVELALQRIPTQQNSVSVKDSFRVLDLGTGSGAIALSIANARPDISITAVDVSADALVVARDNARHLAINNVRLLCSDWFSELSGECFDLIVSNPPYIAEADIHLTQGDLRFEPSSALSSGVDGLDDIRHIVAQAGNYLAPSGWLLMEHGYAQACSVRALLQQASFADIYSAQDLAGIERVSGGKNFNQ